LLDPATGTQSALSGMPSPDSGGGGFAGDGGPVAAALFANPAAAAGDANGNVYVADAANNRVRRVSAAGIVTTVAGTGATSSTGDGGPAATASLSNPSGVAVGPDGSVYVTDSNGRVRRIDPSGTITTVAGGGATAGLDGVPATSVALEGPMGVGVDAAGELFVGEHYGGRIRMVALDGTIHTIATGRSGTGMAVDGAGNVLFPFGGTVVRLDRSGTQTVVAGRGTTDLGFSGDGGPAVAAQLGGARGVAVDGTGVIYVADSGNRRIRRVDATGIITTVAGTGGRAPSGAGGPAVGAELAGPTALHMGPDGLYVEDRGAGAVWRVDATGRITTAAGSPGPAAVDAAGNVYVGVDGARVVRVAPSGATAVIAGNGVGGYSGDGGPAVDAMFNGIRALAVDAAGNLLIADGANARIRRVTPQGIVSTVVGGEGPGTAVTQPGLNLGLGTVDSMAVDAEGALFFSSELDVFRVRCGVATVKSIGGGPFTIDAAGALYQAYRGGISKRSADGTISIVVGGGSAPWVDGATATSVGFESAPTGIAVGGGGGLFFTLRDRVYRVDHGAPAGAVTAGTFCDTPPTGPMWGFGWNGVGALGDGTTASRPLPDQDHPPLTDVVSVAAGGYHSVALRADGTVWAWGWNAVGQVGDGTTMDRHAPVRVPALSGVVAVAAGLYHSLAVRADGTVWAWGWNPLGELGDGTTVTRTTPVQVVGLTGITAVSGGAFHTLARRADATAWAWGWNGLGQLGDGTTVDRLLPVRVTAVPAVGTVAAGYFHSLAVTNDGRAWAWGWNALGQLGDGTTADHATPAPVGRLTGATAVAGGGYHSLAIRGDGSVWAWGSNGLGQVGVGSATIYTSPVRTSLPFNQVAISAGLYHNLAVGSDGRLRGWGTEIYGEVGTGFSSGQYDQRVVPTAGRAVAAAAGALHSLSVWDLR